MLFWDAPPGRLRLPRSRPPRGANPGLAIPLTVTVRHSWITFAPSGGTLIALGLFFAKAGAFIFGGGLAIVLFLREGVVVQHQWLTSLLGMRQRWQVIRRAGVFAGGQPSGTTLQRSLPAPGRPRG